MEKWQFIEGILTGMASLAAIVGFLKVIAVSLQEKKLLRSALADIANVENEKELSKQFKSYVKHKVVDLYSGEEVNIKQLRKTLNYATGKNKIIFLFGDPGSGKTTLMRHLVYWYCLHKHKKVPDREGLEAWGVLYFRMRDISNLEEYLLNELTGGVEIKALFLDGLDEYVVLQDKPAEEVLKELFQLLFGNGEVSKKMKELRKICISSRKEPFHKMPENIIKELDLEYPPKLLEICPFSRKQILALYKKKGGGSKGGKNFNKMRKFLDNEIGFFRIPLFVEYADVILESPVYQKESPMIGEAIDIIVMKWLEKEYRRWYDSLGKSDNENFEGKLDYYLEKAWKLIDNISWHMLNENIMKFKLRQFVETYFSMDQNYIPKENVFEVATRQIIRRINDEEYEFVHSFFGDFFKAHLLFINKDIAYAKKRNILKGNKNLMDFYAFWIWKSQIDEKNLNQSWLPSLKALQESLPNYHITGDKKSEDNFLRQTCNFLSTTKMRLSEQINMTINNILWLFPEIREIRWKKYCLSLLEIKKLMEEGSLALVDKALDEISDLEYFFPVKDLDIHGNFITEIEVLKKNQNMTRLCLYDNQIRTFLPLKEIKIFRLEVEISDINTLKEIFSLPYWECCYIKMPAVANLYLKLYELHKRRSCSYLASALQIEEFKEYSIKEELENRVELFDAVFHLLKDSIAVNEEGSIAFNTIEFGIEIGICVYRMGDYTKALKKFEETNTLLNEQKMPDNLQKIRIKGWKGSILARLEKYEEAIQYLDELSKGYWEEDLKDERKVFWYWWEKCKYREGDWNWRLKNQSQEDKQLKERMYGNKEFCNLLLDLGTSLDKAGEHNGAIEVLMEYYEKHRNCKGAEDVDTLTGQFWLGSALYNGARYKEAEEMLRECYEYECINEEKAPNIELETLQWLGKTLYKEGKIMESQEVMRECYQHQKKVFDTDDKKIMVTRYWLKRIEEKISKNTFKGEELQ